MKTKKNEAWHVRIILIAIMFGCLSPQVATSSITDEAPDSGDIGLKGEWSENDKDRSLLFTIPITAHNKGNMIAIQNTSPNCDITICIINSATGQTVYEQRAPQTETVYIVIPLNTLPNGQQYRLELRNAYGGYLYGNFVNKHS